MKFSYQRTIHFAETDASGVLYFANYLSICHEAFEEALLHAHIRLENLSSDHQISLSIDRCRADYFIPLKYGDTIEVSMNPTLVSEHSFYLEYRMRQPENDNALVARAHTEHTCVSWKTKDRQPLPQKIVKWINELPPYEIEE